MEHQCPLPSSYDILVSLIWPQKHTQKPKNTKKKTLQEFCNNRDTSEHDKNL